MPLFSYKIRDADGNLMEGQAEAFSADALASQFQASHTVPISITEANEKQSLDLGKYLKCLVNKFFLFLLQM